MLVRHAAAGHYYFGGNRHRGVSSSSSKYGWRFSAPMNLVIPHKRMECYLGVFCSLIIVRCFFVFVSWTTAQFHLFLGSVNTFLNGIILRHQARPGLGNHTFIRKHESCLQDAYRILMVFAIQMAFVDKVELNMQNYHRAIHDILQVVPCPYRLGAGFRKRNNWLKLQIDFFKIPHFMLPRCSTCFDMIDAKRVVVRILRNSWRDKVFSQKLAGGSLAFFFSF